jgi:hypothetical protein
MTTVLVLNLIAVVLLVAALGYVCRIPYRIADPVATDESPAAADELERLAA